MSDQLRTLVATAIRTLVEGRGATLDSVASEAALMNLECVIADTPTADGQSLTLDAVAGVMIRLLEEAANSLDPQPFGSTTPNRAAAARAALGVEDGTRGRPLTGRRNAPGRLASIAGWLGYQTDSVMRDRAGRPSPLHLLVDEVAEYVVRREIEHRVAERWEAQRLRRPPLESAMRVDWLARFERYYIIWSYINGIRFDLALAAESGQTPEGFEQYATKALWHYARFVTELEKFSLEHGGLWITPNPAAEQTIADAVWKLRAASPFSELDDSVLRIAIADIDEMAIFFVSVPNDAAMRGLSEKWQTWLGGCSCGETASESCTVHQCIKWSQAFVEAVDSEWDRLADWYDIARPSSAVQPGMRRA
jgi:hypothetical protein